MRKIGLFVLVLVMAISVVAYAAPEGKVEAVFTDEALATTNTATSRAFLIKSGGYFGAWIKATTPAPGQGLHTPNIDIVYQMSYDKTTGFATPTTAVAVVDDLANTDVKVVTISPTPMKYIRFVAYGNSANTTGTTITMKLFSQE